MRKEGKNPYNNRVIVDFEKKTIKFIPIGKKGIRKYYYMFLMTLTMLYTFIVLAPLVIITTIINLIDPSTVNLTIAMTLYALLQMILMLIYFSSWFYRKEWRSKYYPELNAKIVNVINFGMKKKKKTVEPKSMIGNKVIIPHFNNVWLKYEVTNDFSKQLKSIRIINLFKADPINWNCCFEFKKKPKDGKLEVEYA